MFIVLLSMMLAGSDPELVHEFSLSDLGIFQPTLEHPMMTVDEQGRMVVADQNGPRLLWLSPKGKTLGIHEKKGQGPGEFQRIDMVCRNQKGQHVIWDGMARRLSYLESEGNFIKNQTFEQIVRQPFMSEEGVFFYVMRDGNGRELEYHLRRIDESGSIKEIFAGKAPGAVMMKWIPRMEYAANKGLAAVNMGTNKELHIIDLESHQQRMVTLDLPSVPVSESYFESEVTRISRGGKGVPRSMIPQPENWPVVRKLIIDYKDRIWVFAWHEPGEKGNFLVFDKQGKPVGAGRIAGDVHVIREGLLYAIHVDAEDDLQLRQYKYTL